MNAKKFSDAMSELDCKYIDEALNYKKKAKKPRWIKWGVIAACLCLIVPLTAFAIDTIQYNAAVDYLTSPKKYLTYCQIIKNRLKHRHR